MRKVSSVSRAVVRVASLTSLYTLLRAQLAYRLCADQPAA